MKIAVCSIGVGNDDYAKYTLVNIRTYCNMNGYDFICIDNKEDLIDKSRHPKWNKVKLVERILSKNVMSENVMSENVKGVKKYDYVMWMDSDAVITNKSIKIEDIINSIDNKYDIIIAKEDCCDHCINTGVIIIKNSEYSMNFLKLWYDQKQFIEPNPWRDNSAFIHVYDKYADVRNHTKLVKQRLLNSFIMVKGREGQEGIWQKGDFICHFAGVIHGRVRLKRMGYYGNPLWMDKRDKMGLLLNKLGLNGIGVEIGVEKGVYSEILLNTSKLQKLYSIDPWIYFDGAICKNQTNLSNETHAIKFNETKKRLSNFKKEGRSEILRMTSAEAVKLPIFKDGSLDFVYIDGNHTYKYVLEDINNWLPKVKKGGILAGHDYVDDNTTTGRYGVRRAVNDFFKDWKEEIFITPEQWPTWYLIIDRELIDRGIIDRTE